MKPVAELGAAGIAYCSNGKERFYQDQFVQQQRAIEYWVIFEKKLSENDCGRNDKWRMIKMELEKLTAQGGTEGDALKRLVDNNCPVSRKAGQPWNLREYQIDLFAVRMIDGDGYADGDLYRARMGKIFVDNFMKISKSRAGMWHVGKMETVGDTAYQLPLSVQVNLGDIFPQQTK